MVNTHSHSDGMGWLTAIKNQNVKAIISYEPGSGFAFPKDELPAPVASSAGPLEATAIAKEEFLKLTKIPIIIYYGDNIPEKLDKDNPGADGWRARLEMARIWAETINKHVEMQLLYTFLRLVSKAIRIFHFQI